MIWACSNWWRRGRPLATRSWRTHWPIIALTCLVLATMTGAIVVISRRYISRPLAELQQSAAAIGAGNLQTTIDVEGRDEIGGLARTFDAMRCSIIDLVGELGESNRQLELTNDTLEERVRMRTEEALATRQKLVDAVESTSEGFAFFDADDRLVLNNTQYEKLLYGGTDIRIAPGVTFEEILRLGIERGLITHEEASDEAFIAERLHQHRNPGAPILQRRGERSWIQINERKISDGGTVAVFSDVSELKNREADLTEKTITLQHLSSQLAKYLSPQIYKSIFKGDQEVKVASSRKKLTVFFSDIEDFTEIAERMESEELTSLLNSYSDGDVEDRARVRCYDRQICWRCHPGFLRRSGVQGRQGGRARLREDGRGYGQANARAAGAMEPSWHYPAAPLSHRDPYRLLHGRQFRQREPDGLHHYRARGEHGREARNQWPSQGKS